MSTKTLRVLLCFLSLALVPGGNSLAQEGGDRDRDRDRSGSPGGPGGPGNLGNPGGPKEPHHNNREKGRNTIAPPRNSLQFGPVGRWWDDRSVTQKPWFWIAVGGGVAAAAAVVLLLALSGKKDPTGSFGHVPGN